MFLVNTSERIKKNTFRNFEKNLYKTIMLKIL